MMRDVVVATLKVGSGQVVTLLCAALSAKVMAIAIGPAGVGVFSILRQFQQMLTAVASLGGHNAVVQGVASHQGVERDRFIVSVFAIIAGLSLITAAAIIISATPLAGLVFGGSESISPSVIRWAGVAVAIGTLLVFFRGLLNAHMEMGAVAWVNITAAASSVVFVFPAVVAYNAGHRFVLALLLGASLGCGLILAIQRAWEHQYLRPLDILSARAFDHASVSHFFRVALPSLVAMFAGLASVLLVKAMIARRHGLPATGQFDAAWSISAIYLIVFLSSLHTYLLPALSAHGVTRESRDVLDSGLRFAAIVALPLVTTLIVLKPLAIRLLYSGAFIGALEVLRWTLLGDYIRVPGWILATALFARADMRAYLTCEVMWSGVFAAMASVLLEERMAGAGPAYVTAYACYLIVLIYRARTRHRVVIRAPLIRAWCAGAFIVVLASLSTWTAVRVAWPTVGWIPIAVLFSWIALAQSERHHIRSYLMRLAGR